MAVLEPVTRLFYGVAAGLLGLLSLAMLAIALYELGHAALAGEAVLRQTLESIGLVTIAIAVFEVGKFLVEEELVRERQLRSVLESRRSLTKFLTLIVIIMALEGIVLIFEVKLENVAELIYPTALLAVAVLAVVGLGLFQRLSAEGGSNLIGDDPPDGGPHAPDSDGAETNPPHAG